MSGPALLTLISRMRPVYERSLPVLERWLHQRPAPLFVRLVHWSIQAARLVWPDAWDARTRERWRGFVQALAERSYYPALDAFQRESVRAMQHETGRDMVSRLTSDPEGRKIYQVLLAVRGADTPTQRRPLVGLIEMSVPTPEPQEIIWTRIILALAGLLAGFFAILVFYLVSHKLILAPVRDLKALVTRVAEGDLSARSRIDTGDEYQELSTAFNAMLNQLESSRNELETINRSLDTRLGELAESNVTLFESNRLKSEFLANVSHELKTPLTSILGFADLLNEMSQSDGGTDKERLMRYARNILESGRSLLVIITDLLDVAKIEAGKIELHRSRFSIRDLCEDLVDFLKPMTDKKELELTLHLDENLPVMNTDAGRLRQILFNLLSNAIKYTPEGGRVRMEVTMLPGGGVLRFEVIDTGPGIAREDQERIFEKFRQLDSSRTREHGGTGLGLAISRELARILGGSLRVESEPGEGARFIVEVPLECPKASYRPVATLMG
jgi:signal transduction histidine kinase